MSKNIPILQIQIAGEENLLFFSQFTAKGFFLPFYSQALRIGLIYHIRHDEEVDSLTYAKLQALKLPSFGV